MSRRKREQRIAAAQRNAGQPNNDGEPRIVGERHIEMLWTCTSCNEKNLGRYKECRTCKNPKDGSEQYEMPEDTSKAATVTDAGLLRMATAGPDWRCAYCSSDQRRSDNGCANCGASAVEGKEVPDDPVPDMPDVPAENAGSGSWGIGVWMMAAAGLIAFFVVVGKVLDWNRNRPRDYKATVRVAHWERSIAVERYQIQNSEGFKDTLPADAFAIKSIGKKVHHHEQVPDGFNTERYSVEVPDGYRTESYTERVSCGEDCTTTPESCSEKCTSNKNGFATCRTVCSGGGQRCRTRYCSESRTREVPKTRTEWRTRQVPKFRSEPRYAEGFSYKRWEWLPARTVNAAGDALPATWPDSKLNQGLGPGEKEREQRTENYKVTLVYDKDKQFLDFAPKDEATFSRYPKLSEHRMHTVKGTISVDGDLIEPIKKE